MNDIMMTIKLLVGGVIFNIVSEAGLDEDVMKRF